MTQKLNQLQQAIREVCMELKELTFGCEVLHKSTNDVRHVVSDSVAGVCAGVCISTPRTGIVMYHHHFNELFEIIGHPIQLQHILRAIPYKRFCNLVMNEEDGTGIVVDDSDLIPYNLTLPLDQQAPEVVDFLHSIICKG